MDININIYLATVYEILVVCYQNECECVLRSPRILDVFFSIFSKMVLVEMTMMLQVGSSKSGCQEL